METDPTRIAAQSKARRRWYQYSLRTLLIGVVVLSLPLAYVGWQAKIVRQRKQLLSHILDHGGAYYAMSSVNSDSFLVGDWPPTVAGAEHPEQWSFIRLAYRDTAQEPSGLRMWLGDVSVPAICLTTTISSDETVTITALFPEAGIGQECRLGKQPAG